MASFFKTSAFAILLVFTTCFSFCQEYGLVLEGGGGKGAYEAGVWACLNEYGIAQKVTGISGTSVGGLNAALFATESAERIIKIWHEAVPENLSGKHQTLLDGIDEDGVGKLIDEVHLEKFLEKNFFPKVYVTASRKKLYVLKWLSKPLLGDDVFACRFCLNEEGDVSEIRKELLATSAFPLWQTDAVKLKDGYEYVDGGVSDNLPIKPILDDDKIETVFVVHLDSSARGNKLYSARYSDSGKKIIDVVPSEDLGGVFSGLLNFKQSRIDFLITLGYRDCKKVLEEQGFKPISVFWFEE